MNFNDVKIGSIVKIAGINWIVLDKHFDEVLCLTKDFISQCEFDRKTNNYAKSAIRQYLNGQFLSEISSKVGENKIVRTYIDLISDDGLDDYGYVDDKIGLLTVDMYRRYNRIIEKYKVNNWWWLSTAYSTPHRSYSAYVRCVINGGALTTAIAATII